MNELETILNKYFGDDDVRYFHPADRIANDQYLRWEYSQHERNKILISIGSNDGEVQVKIFTNPEELETFIKLVIY